MKKEDRGVFRQANLLANWSFIGILAPLIGWVLGSISLSNLKSLSESKNNKDLSDIQSVRNKAILGLMTSTTVFVLLLAVYAWAFWPGRNSNQQEKPLQQVTVNSETPESRAASILPRLNPTKYIYPEAVDKSYLENCIKVTSADHNFSDTITDNYCGCTLFQIRNNYTLEQFITINQNYADSGHFPEELNSLIAYCLEHAEDDKSNSCTKLPDGSCVKFGS